jgi:hypothetical protein
MREKMLSNISRAYRQPACVRCCPTYLAHIGCLHLRENVVRHIPRIQAACMRERMLSDISRAHRQPACARRCCPTYPAHTGSLHARGDVVRHISRIQAACARRCCPTYLAHTGSLHARGDVVRHISRIQAACMREICRTTFFRRCRQLIYTRYVGQYDFAQAGHLYARDCWTICTIMLINGIIFKYR